MEGQGVIWITSPPVDNFLTNGNLITSESWNICVHLFFRRQNEDLRAKLDAGGVNPNTSLAVESNKNEAEMRKIAEKECESLRTTVAKLDRLLNIEREERALNEKKTLDVSPACILLSSAE